MRNRALLIVISVALILLIGIVALIHNMGGFNDPVMSLTTSDTHIIVGKAFSGPSNAGKIGELWGEMEKMAEGGLIEGDVAAVWYNEPSENDTLHAFIGVLVADDAMSIPDGYEVLKIEPRQVVRAEQESHHLVAGPLYEHIKDFAKDRDVKLSQESLEIYPGEQQVIFEVPVVE